MYRHGPQVRRRFAVGRLAGLADAARSGRPPVFTAADRAEVIALACALPAESGVPLSKWNCPDLARELAARCHITVSASTIRRWLARDALKPWQYRSWISVRDPQFTAKAAPVLDLYAGTWDGRPPSRLRQIHAFFRARSPDQMLDTAAPWTSPWLPPGYEQNFWNAA